MTLAASRSGDESGGNHTSCRPDGTVQRPAHKFVASFTESTPMNFLSADIVSQKDEMPILRMVQTAPFTVTPRRSLDGKRLEGVEIGIWPEYIDLGAPEYTRAVLRRAQFVNA